MKILIFITLTLFSQILIGSKPNIIFILTDDQRYDEIGAVRNFHG